MRVLIANRAEIAIRIARAAAELGMATVGVHAADDARSLHVLRTDLSVPLTGSGPAAYLDGEGLVRVALATGCDAVHPGYGFLSEDAGFARRCVDAGLTWVGPSPQVLAQVGDKVRARDLAASVGLPVIEGSGEMATAADAEAFFGTMQGAPMILKAVAGGGGRGLRVVRRADEVAAAFARCRAEAGQAFGHGEVFGERYLPSVRHLEVQVLGDGRDVIHLGERDCSLQRRRQKVIELAPAPRLHPGCRARLVEAGGKLAKACHYAGLGTMEFLVDAATASTDAGAAFWFLECNPRLQVEHTVTEQVTGVDLVQAQLRVADGESLADQGLDQSSVGRTGGFAIELRVNAEVVEPSGEVRPSGGTLTAFEPPTGPGVRVDSSAYAGYETNPNYDPLLAKVVVSIAKDDLPTAMAKALRALSELRIEGVATNQAFLRALLERPELPAWAVDSGFVEDHLGELVGRRDELHDTRWFTPSTTPPDRPADGRRTDAPAGTEPVVAPLRAVVAAVTVNAGDQVRAGQEVAVLEAMKMQHSLTTGAAGVVRAVTVSAGDVVDEGAPVLFVEAIEGTGEWEAEREVVDLDHIRPDLAELLARTATTLDANRPDAIRNRHQRGQRTARENVEDLCDEGSFLEYGQLIVAGQRRIRSLEDLMASTPADGLVAGIGSVNGDLFGAETARAAVLAYDYTVLAGTQGAFNHKKTDRVLEQARKWRLPIVFFTEGGGGRPGDTDFADVSFAALDIATFATFAASSGGAPRIAVNSGYCFAGNAVLFGCADVTIATRDSSIGLAGPVMIEGGGLGSYRPQDVGPIDVQVANGVVDLVADDEADAVALAKQVLGYFQGTVSDWTCADQRRLRHVIPEDRKRVYDVRSAIELLVDEGSLLELRPGYGVGMVTALGRIEGRPIGVFANDPRHLGGAIDAEAAEKAARFMQLCDAFDLPLLSLCDTPGFMVGPHSEQEGTVRRAASMAVVGANVTVPLFMVVTRKGYGLGAMAMGGGSFWEPMLTAAWPSAEFGAMGLEGAVRIIFRKELDAAPDEAARQAIFDRRVADIYERGKALSVARYLEIDAVIDPAETRRWLVGGLDAASKARTAVPPKRPFVDPW